MVLFYHPLTYEILFLFTFQFSLDSSQVSGPFLDLGNPGFLIHLPGIIQSLFNSTGFLTERRALNFHIFLTL
ncbi:hypothetical protein MSBRM_2265 [Methanosarcina barkeri MS]|uniref:Uncharacterized protein n=1 Tax=Methanosarcina barkeri MS TaxID=1434108 RepID=A0A0E3QWU0_METBA|nr:hypothetical protein MSBRM_2265 [Methanosarcina barkeri MS]